MGVGQMAMAAGFKAVKTLAGPVPLEQWVCRDQFELKFDAERGVILGAWRPASTIEEMLYEERGGRPVIGLQARDTWELVRADDEAGEAVFSFDGADYSLASMLGANSDDPALCEWLVRASVGDVFDGCERVK